MPPWKKYVNPKFYFVLLIVVFSVALSAVISLSESVEDQSLLELQSLTPAFDIVSHEVLKPLFIAETVARASSLKSHMNHDVIDGKKMMVLLDELSKEFDMNFFVASEISRMQYFSDGSTLPLVSEKVEWYFRAKKSSQNVVAALGNRDDIHIYFDIKIHNEQGEFIGFIGVSKRLDRIISTFENNKNTYDYDFIFVDGNQDIVLSSDEKLLADGKRIKNIRQLSWFQALTPLQQSGSKPNDNILVDVEGEDLLITKVDLKALNWKLYLVNSLQVRQSETIKLFMMQTLNLALVLLLAVLIARIGIPYVQAEFASKYQIDPLTQLPNRAYLAWCFKQLKKEKQSVCAIIVDIDHFKLINDTYGHAVGDVILCEFANLLKTQLRDVDVIGRWGGEEFVILLPATDFQIAYEVAERARVEISKFNFTARGKILSMSASFGVAFRATAYKLEDIVTHADEALYMAKREGRNTVRTTNDLKDNTPQKVPNFRLS
ncbi:MAG: sensor domain-containing diguanylate cyclase [Paraglaciecola sp.]|uniref:sensor domain-containing diguanylate cyclase n=1 Tax=Paraglaciecola sp. TaxID=1920173 RepID=UPI003297F104